MYAHASNAHTACSDGTRFAVEGAALVSRLKKQLELGRSV